MWDSPAAFCRSLNKLLTYPMLLSIINILSFNRKFAVMIYPLFEDNWICVKYNSHKLLTFLKHEILSFSQKVETCIRMINFTKFANFELISFKISVTL